jgi:hypothetical protein
MSKKIMVETIQEFLARGGSINKVAPIIVDAKPDIVRKTVAGEPAIIMTLDEADLFYGEARKGSKPKKTKPSLKIDLNALPEALRTKFLNRLKEETGGEDYEESSEEEDEEIEN